MNIAPAPFTPGDRVTRRFDGATGTVETVTPWDSDTGSWAVAVRLDKDGEVWSGTEVAWARLELWSDPAWLDQAASFDEVEAAGLDATLRDGRGPYTNRQVRQAPAATRCPDHHAYDADYCPVCGTARVIGGNR